MENTEKKAVNAENGRHETEIIEESTPPCSDAQQNTGLRNFLTLLTAYFAISAFFSVINLTLICDWLPSWNITINGYERSMTSYIIRSLSTAAFLVIFIKLLKGKEYGLTSRSKAGIVLMTICLFNILATESIILNSDQDQISKRYFITGMIDAAVFIINTTGLFMFVNGSPAERKLKRFVKWTPFISLTISVIISMIPMAYSSPASSITYTSVDLIYFLVVYRMARKSV